MNRTTKTRATLRLIDSMLPTPLVQPLELGEPPLMGEPMSRDGFMACILPRYTFGSPVLTRLYPVEPPLELLMRERAETVAATWRGKSCEHCGRELGPIACMCAYRALYKPFTRKRPYYGKRGIRSSRWS